MLGDGQSTICINRDGGEGLSVGVDHIDNDHSHIHERRWGCGFHQKELKEKVSASNKQIN
jgi:hypothetical protein